jgi:hypothetical protein
MPAAKARLIDLESMRQLGLQNVNDDIKVPLAAIANSDEPHVETR